MSAAETSIARARTSGPGVGALIGFAALADILLLRAWLMQDLPMIAVMGLHLGLVALFAGLCRAMLGRGAAATWAMTAILALFGPFGGLALMLIGPGQAGASGPAQAGAGPRPAAAPEALADSIMQRRRHPLPLTGMPGFVQVFRTGTMQQQQRAIAAISRHYHPDMRPALATALASPVPALRVQAAAVHAKLRGSFEAQAKAILADPASADAATIHKVAASGFVDDETRLLLLALAADHAPPAAPLPRAPLLPAPRLKRYSCGGLA